MQLQEGMGERVALSASSHGVQGEGVPKSQAARGASVSLRPGSL